MLLDGKKVKDLVKLHGLTQDDLAAKVGVARQTVCQWLNRKQHVAPKNLIRISSILQCSPADIVEDAPLFCAATRGDKFARAVLVEELGKSVSEKTWNMLGTHDYSDTSRGDKDTSNYTSQDIVDLLQVLSSYIAKTVRKDVASSSLEEVAGKAGLPPSQIECIANGEADMSLFPLGALLRLCPQLINNDVLAKTLAEAGTWLMSAIADMNEQEKQMLKNLIQAAMPRFASHCDKKTSNPEPDTQFESGSPEISKP